MKLCIEVQIVKLYEFIPKKILRFYRICKLSPIPRHSSSMGQHWKECLVYAAMYMFDFPRIWENRMFK